MRAHSAGSLENRLTITTAGAPPSPTTILQMERMGFRIVHVYGLTETYGPYSVNQYQHDWDDLPEEERAVLQARQGVGMLCADWLRVVDEQMNDVPADGSTMGEVVMRGNNVMLGYYDDPAATEEAFTGGWFHSGDLGVMHPDGYVELRDRAKDVVVSGGENISTIEVEQAVVSHPAVVEAAVIGVPDEEWGERPKAFVVLTEGESATEDELIEHVKSKIARYKAPKSVEIVDELPKTSHGQGAEVRAPREGVGRRDQPHPRLDRTARRVSVPEWTTGCRLARCGRRSGPSRPPRSPCCRCSSPVGWPCRSPRSSGSTPPGSGWWWHCSSG